MFSRSNNRAAALVLALLSLPAVAKPEHSSMQGQAIIEGAKLKLEFKVLPKADMVVNDEGPWKLEIKKADGLVFAKTVLVKTDFDLKLPGFIAQAEIKDKTTKGEIEYVATVFVCDKAKTRCFREQHSEKLSWGGGPDAKKS